MAEWMRGRRRGVVGVDGRDLFVLVLAVTVCVATRTSEAAFTNFAKTSRSNNGITTMSSGGQSSSDAVFNIRTFGAHGNGASDDTKVRSKKRRVLGELPCSWTLRSGHIVGGICCGSDRRIKINHLIALKWIPV